MLSDLWRRDLKIALAVIIPLSLLFKLFGWFFGGSSNIPNDDAYVFKAPPPSFEASLRINRSTDPELPQGVLLFAELVFSNSSPDNDLKLNGLSSIWLHDATSGEKLSLKSLANFDGLLPAASSRKLVWQINDNFKPGEYRIGADLTGIAPVKPAYSGDLKLKIDNRKASQAEKAFYKMQLLKATGQYEKLLEETRAKLKENPNSPLLLLEEANALQLTGEHDQATQALLKIQEKLPKDNSKNQCWLPLRLGPTDR